MGNKGSRRDDVHDGSGDDATASTKQRTPLPSTTDDSAASSPYAPYAPKQSTWPVMGKMIGEGSKDGRTLEEQLKKPIQEIINNQIASTAADSIRESDIIVKDYAKALIMDTLNDKESRAKVGIILQGILAHEPVLQPTRALVYWGVQSESSVNNLAWQSKYGLNQWVDLYGEKVVSKASVDYLDSMHAQHIVIKPILLWVLKQKAWCQDPAAANVVYSLPWAKVQHNNVVL
jgi:hypothetical protein